MKVSLVKCKGITTSNNSLIGSQRNSASSTQNVCNAQNLTREVSRVVEMTPPVSPWIIMIARESNSTMTRVQLVSETKQNSTNFRFQLQRQSLKLL